MVDGDGDAGILRELRDRVVDGADWELEDDEHRDGEREHRAVHVVRRSTAMTFANVVAARAYSGATAAAAEAATAGQRRRRIDPGRCTRDGNGARDAAVLGAEAATAANKSQKTPT